MEPKESQSDTWNEKSVVFVDLQCFLWTFTGRFTLHIYIYIYTCIYCCASLRKFLFISQVLDGSPTVLARRAIWGPWVTRAPWMEIVGNGNWVQGWELDWGNSAGKLCPNGRIDFQMRRFFWVYHSLSRSMNLRNEFLGSHQRHRHASFVFTTLLLRSSDILPFDVGSWWLLYVFFCHQTRQRYTYTLDIWCTFHAFFRFRFVVVSI